MPWVQGQEPAGARRFIWWVAGGASAALVLVALLLGKTAANGEKEQDAPRPAASERTGGLAKLEAQSPVTADHVGGGTAAQMGAANQGRGAQQATPSADDATESQALALAKPSKPASGGSGEREQVVNDQAASGAGAQPPRAEDGASGRTEEPEPRVDLEEQERSSRSSIRRERRRQRRQARAERRRRAAADRQPNPRRLRRAGMLKERARERYAAKDYRKAARAYHRVTNLTPKDAGAYAGLGAALLELGKPRRAVRAYRAAVRLRPETSGFHAALGRAYFEAGARERSRRAYRRALRLNPKNTAARAAIERLQ